jgi:hypothetical protein
MSKKPTKIIKTITVQHRFNKHEFKILKFMTKIAKNVYNTYIFYFDIYRKYKTNIFQDLQGYMLSNNKLKYNDTIANEINRLITKYYNHYINIKYIIKNNNRVIYKHIIRTFEEEDIKIHNGNLKDLYIRFSNELEHNNELVNHPNIS